DCTRYYNTIVDIIKMTNFDLNFVNMIIVILDDTKFFHSYNSLLGYAKYTKLQLQRNTMMGIFYEYIDCHCIKIKYNLNIYPYIEKYSNKPKINWNDIFCMLMCEDSFFVNKCTAITRELRVDDS